LNIRPATTTRPGDLHPAGRVVELFGVDDDVSNAGIGLLDDIAAHLFGQSIPGRLIRDLLGHQRFLELDAVVKGHDQRHRPAYQSLTPLLKIKPENIVLRARDR
jgi:hypothetical protein